MKLELGVDRAIDDPDAECVARSLTELDWKKAHFAKLSRDKLNYVRATGDHRNGFLVENQDGPEKGFFRASNKVDLKVLQRAFVAYNRGDSSFCNLFHWQKIEPRHGAERVRVTFRVIGIIAMLAFLLYLAIKRLLR